MSFSGASPAARLRLAAAPLALALALAGCAHAPHGGSAAAEITHPEGAIFDPSIDANAAVDAALAMAATNGTRVLLVLGANWCHDSRALTSMLMQPRLAALLAEKYETVYIDVGLPQTGDGFNLDIAERFGTAQEGTPNLLVVTPDGTLVNAGTTTGWRNSASRSEAEILAELETLAAAAPPAAQP